MTRRTLEETRQLLLGAAVEMLHEHGTIAGVGHIRISDVVERVGLTTGAAYRCWEDQSAFHRDLAVAAVRWRDYPAPTHSVHAIRACTRPIGSRPDSCELWSGDIHMLGRT